MFIDNRNETMLRTAESIFGNGTEGDTQFSSGRVGNDEHDCSNCECLKEAPCHLYQNGECKGPEFPCWREQR